MYDPEDFDGRTKKRKIEWAKGCLDISGRKTKVRNRASYQSNPGSRLITKEVLDPRLRRRACKVNDIQQQEPEPQMRETRDYEDPASANRHVQSGQSPRGPKGKSPRRLLGWNRTG